MFKVEFFDGFVEKRNREADRIEKRPSLMIKFTNSADGCLSSSERPATEQDEVDFKSAFEEFKNEK